MRGFMKTKEKEVKKKSSKINCNREKCLSLSSEYKNFSFFTQILSPLKCFKRSESKIDSHS